jgi:PAS domain-containing protein
MAAREGDWRDELLRTQQLAFVVVDARSGVVREAHDLFADPVDGGEATTGTVIGRSLDAVVEEVGFFSQLVQTRPSRVALPRSTRHDALDVEASVHEVLWRRRPALLLVVDVVERQHRLQRVLDELAEFPRTNPGPVLRLDREGCVVLANEAAGRLFGRADLVGASWPGLCEGVTADLWAEVIRTEGQLTHETDVGDRRMSFTHVYQPTRKVVFVYGTDVTKLRRQEGQLAEQARFPDMNPGPVLRLDLDGKVLLSNVAARELLPEATIGVSWLETVPGVDAAFWSTVLEAASPVVMDAMIHGRDFQFTHRLDPGRNVFVYGAMSPDRRQRSALRGIRSGWRRWAPCPRGLPMSSTIRRPQLAGRPRTCLWRWPGCGGPASASAPCSSRMRRGRRSSHSRRQRSLAAAARRRAVPSSEPTARMALTTGLPPTVVWRRGLMSPSSGCVWASVVRS